MANLSTAHLNASSCSRTVTVNTTRHAPHCSIGTSPGRIGYHAGCGSLPIRLAVSRQRRGELRSEARGLSRREDDLDTRELVGDRVYSRRPSNVGYTICAPRGRLTEGAARNTTLISCILRHLKRSAVGCSPGLFSYRHTVGRADVRSFYNVANTGHRPSSAA